jgi:hypothetical protein
MWGQVLETPPGVRWHRESKNKANPAYFETQLAQLQSYASGKASHDHAEISISMENHHIFPVLCVFAHIDVDLHVYLTRLS